MLATPGENPAENYERFFVPLIGAPLAAEIIEAAALGAGERVLDVACGTGVVTRLARQCVGASGSVAGLDVNGYMLDVARDVSPDKMKIDWHEAPMQSMPLADASFDAVLCQLGLQFAPDRPAALTEMKRVLAPGGRLVLNVPGPTPPLFAVADAAFARHLGAEAAGFLHAVFSLHEPGEIRELLLGAGFREVAVRSENKTLRLPAPKDFLWQYLLSTPLAATVREAGTTARAELEREIVEKWQPFVEDGGITYRQDITTATAQK